MIAWRYAPQLPDVIDKLRAIDDRYDLHRGSIGGLEQDGLLVGQPVDDAMKLERPTVISLSGAKAKILNDLGAQSVLDSCESLSWS